LISCIVPVFNGERYLKEALDSILAQTYRPIEIIVVDDGSTDGTPAVVATYGAKVRYLFQLNEGPAAARNIGLNTAQGAFVAFLDHDDLWHPEKLARQMARFQARPELDVCVTHVRHFWIPELIEEEKRVRGDWSTKARPGYCPGTLLARRTAFDTVGQLNPGLWHCNTSDWFLRAAAQGVVVELLPELLTYHRLHHTNLSRLGASAGREEYLQLVKASLDRRRLPQNREVVGPFRNAGPLDPKCSKWP
jgi:glycosyltransferase involved in cell wall biosynthesis